MTTFVPPDAAGSLIADYSTQSRLVYEYLFDPQWMIKYNDPNWAVFNKLAADKNQFELDNYQNFTQINWAQWMAPCKMENNLFLMRRPTPLAPGNYQVPKFFNKDSKQWGMLDGQLVTVRYPFHSFFENGLLCCRFAYGTAVIPERFGLQNTNKFPNQQYKAVLDQETLNYIKTEFQTITVS